MVVDGRLAPLYAARAEALPATDGIGLDVIAESFAELGYTPAGRRVGCPVRHSARVGWPPDPCGGLDNPVACAGRALP